MEMYRQGDLLFIPKAQIPEKAKRQEDGVIAKGEVTGHSHRIKQNQQALLMIATGIAYIRALKEAEIVHEEHDTITLPPGNWEVRRQEEYRPTGWRQVDD